MIEAATPNGDTIRSQPVDPARDLAGLEYHLSVASSYGDTTAAADLASRIARLRVEHPHLA
ncbi:hypothetical protein [Microbacterium sp. 5K110]|uniref:hypothetical protein n=1 Tax=unclassified Microbacterium TaxID=2609290 RepID=UPI0010FF1F3A|nr:hypothetical protein [Microbacterium sp. 5K110]TLF33945.1 hypothetical protein FE256_02170 [Microbacterium sp. 5K110]